MRRAFLVPPLVLLVAATPGCALQASTPSMTAADLPQAPLHDASLPARADALAAWMLPDANPWAGYAKYTLLTSLGEAAARADLPDVTTLDDVRRARAVGERLGAGGLPADTLWLVDMRGAASVAFGEALARSTPGGGVSLVPTFNNWPGDHEVVPAEETLAAMVATPPSSQGDATEGARPVFLLDAWRMAALDDEPDDDDYDNRYMLSPSDLPDAATLRARGIRRVVYVVYTLEETTLEEDDVHAAFLAWQEAGIGVAMVDLAALDRPIAPPEWDDVFATGAYVAAPRVTVVDDPAFYVRAHGGFGGIHAHPFHLGGGHAGHFGAHGGGG